MFWSIDSLPSGLIKACVVPRPIAWISTVDGKDNFNLAPYSYFNLVSENPPCVMFSTTNAHIEGGEKDTLRNVKETKVFCPRNRCQIKKKKKSNANFKNVD